MRREVDTERVQSEFGRYPAVDYEALRERVEQAAREAHGDATDG
jgi:hypothetical protein